MEQVKKVPKCLNPSCYSLPVFPSWDDLAHHILENKATHPRSSLIFAYHVLSEVDNVKEKSKPHLPPVEPTAFGNKQRALYPPRIISGETEEADVKCPNCRKSYRAQVAVEYLGDWDAWRDTEGNIMGNCSQCRIKKEDKKYDRIQVETE